MTPHRIRLRGFWAAAPLPDGRTRHARPFGRPRTLDPDERLWVVGDDPGPVAVAVNGVPVGDSSGGPWAFDLTAHLLPRNALTVDAAESLGEVALEVRSIG